jgi:molybdopterin-containing oxidoreductase family iron-sulfur binding subunit
VESRLSVTGSNADTRVVLRPFEQALAVVYLYNKVASAKGGQAGPSVSFATEGVADKLDKIAAELISGGSNSLFITGLNDPNVQLLGLMINSMLGSMGSGKAIDTDFPNHCFKGEDTAIMNLADMIGSQVRGMITFDCNPVHTAPLSPEERESISGLDFHIAIGDKWNESSEVASHVCPANHYLESWGDAMPSANMLCAQQPTISTIFDTKEVGQMLLDWAGVEKSYMEFMKENWTNSFFSQQSKYSTPELFWNNAIHDGLLELDKASPAVVAGMGAEALVSSAGSQITSNYQPSEGMELELYTKTAIGDGSFADNPWSQEMPDPISRATWDNYVMANKEWMEEQGLFDRTFYNDKYFMQVKLTDESGYSVTLPIIPVPGMQKNTLAVALGYGRSLTLKENFRSMEFYGDEYVGVIGQNMYPMLTWNSNTGSFGNIVSNIKVDKVEEKYAVATIQDNAHVTHMTLGGEKTRLVVKETTLDEFKQDPWAGNTIMGERRDHWVEKHLTTLYGYHDNPGHHWGMSIDLNACYGCGACVVACNAENNVPVVGKEEVRRAHEMHWLRIDRYYTGDDMENPPVVFQPMMCQHCDNAPCENVCPVAATNHSSEGLNQMAYNRCIGTRYCANNCPYKVRRFNWFDYTGSDSFYKDTIFDNDRDAAKMLEDLPRMVLNPDVTIRSRGVMEKCSFCVQRIQYGKLEAKKAGEPLQDGAIQTACQQACATNAIKFGDLNNPEAEVTKLAASPRSFGVIEEIHTLPTVNYLVKVRNVKDEENEMA